VAQVRGLVAMHVAWFELEGAKDWNVAGLAAERGFVVVTKNRRDFLRLCAEREVRSGLIIIVPAVPRDERCRLFGISLDVAEAQDSLVNLLIEVHADGNVDVRNWAKDEPEGRG
jgi:hypothetical protein